MNRCLSCIQVNHSHGIVILSQLSSHKDFISGKKCGHMINHESHGYKNLFQYEQKLVGHQINNFCFNFYLLSLRSLNSNTTNTTSTPTT